MKKPPNTVEFKNMSNHQQFACAWSLVTLFCSEVDNENKHKVYYPPGPNTPGFTLRIHWMNKEHITVMCKEDKEC